MSVGCCGWSVEQEESTVFRQQSTVIHFKNQKLFFMKKHSVIGNHCHPEFIEGWRWLTRCKSHTSTTLSVTTLALLLCSIFIALPASAQVAIGDSLKTAHPSAELEVFSDSKGFLPPRMTTAQRDSIASPADGLIVFDTDLNKLLYYHNDTWKDFGLWSTRDSTLETFITMAVKWSLVRAATQVPLLEH